MTWRRTPSGEGRFLRSGCWRKHFLSRSFGSSGFPLKNLQLFVVETVLKKKRAEKPDRNLKISGNVGGLYHNKRLFARMLFFCFYEHAFLHYFNNVRQSESSRVSYTINKTKCKTWVIFSFVYEGWETRERTQIRAIVTRDSQCPFYSHCLKTGTSVWGSYCFQSLHWMLALLLTNENRKWIATLYAATRHQFWSSADKRGVQHTPNPAGTWL